MPPKKKAGLDKKSGDEEHLTRIAIVNASKCKPKKCNQECKKSCPVVKLGKLCIEVGPKSKLAFISEPLCIGTSNKYSIYRRWTSQSRSRVRINSDVWYVWTHIMHMLMQYSRLRHLCQKMPVWSHQHYQSTKRPREEHHSSLWSELLQAPSFAHAQTGTSAWIGRNQRYW